MSCNNDYNNICRQDIPYPQVSPESVPSLISNLVYALYGDITKSVENGRVVWNIPCDPNNTAEVDQIPREEGEGLLCYLLRVFANSLDGYGTFLRWGFAGSGQTEFTLTGAWQPDRNAYLAYIDGVVQDPIGYTISTTLPRVLTIDTALPSGSFLTIVELSSRAGATGASGAVGSTGATGLVGATGQVGATGLVGATGEVGATGLGATGLTGATGLVGSTGATGAGTTGATGQIGATGLSGSTGASGLRGSTGASGISPVITRQSFTAHDISLGQKIFYYSPTAEVGWTYGSRLRAVAGSAYPPDWVEGNVVEVNNSWVELWIDTAQGAGNFADWIIGIAGDGGLGATGPIGATGLVGATGLGATGSTGPIGSSGATGPQGDPGGATGATGVQGDVGASGATGLQGDVGATGLVGATGDVGATGLVGATGDVGATGIGATGSTGVQGATGLPGQSASFYNYQADAVNISGVPTAGRIIWDNLTQTSATTVTLSHIDALGNDIDVFFPLFKTGDKFVIQDQGNSSNYQTWEISATPTVVLNSYVTIPVTLVTSGGTSQFIDAQNLIFAIVSSGLVGATGATGASGIKVDTTITSNTSNVISLGSKTFGHIAQYNPVYGIGSRVLIARDTSNMMEGVVTTFNTSTTVVNVDTILAGSGTWSTWYISLANITGATGATGPVGATGPSGGGGATGAGTDEIFWENGQTVNTSYSIPVGVNAGSFGPITIASGVTVTIPSGSAWTVV